MWQIVEKTNKHIDFFSKGNNIFKLKKQYQSEYRHILSKTVNNMYPKLKTPNKIINTVKEFFNLQQNFHLSNSRKREVVVGRQVSMRIIYHTCRISLNKTGRYFKNKDHSTVLYAKKTVKNLCDTSKEYRENYLQLLKLLNLKDHEIQ